jgi:hypothetical protein
MNCSQNRRSSLHRDIDIGRSRGLIGLCLPRQCASDGTDYTRDSASSEGHGTGEELVRPKEHLKAHADSGTQATLLLGKILRPGNTGA